MNPEQKIRMRTAALFPLLLATVSVTDLQADFGDRQIAQMIEDRPSMRGIITAGHPIYGFTSEHFNSGGLSGRRVHWDQGEPIYGAEHDCQVVCVVRVTKDAQFTGRDKWAMLVFELFNLTHANAVGSLRWRAVRNEIGRDEFITQSLRLEIEAMHRAQAFLVKHPIPAVDPKTDRFYFSFLNTPSNFDDYVRFLDSTEGYDPREYSGEVYDSLKQRFVTPTRGGALPVVPRDRRALTE